MAVLAPAAELVWRAQPRQREFLRRDEDEVLYGGAAGGGKTDALLIYGIRACLQHAGAAILFLRRTFADLNKPKAAIPRSHELLASTGAAWNGQEHRWTFPNGSLLQFGHVQHQVDMYAYQGAQVDALLWDELTQFTEEQYEFLTSRVRATIEGAKPAIRAATNPGGVGHSWVKARWINVGAWETPFPLFDRETGHQTGTGIFIPAKVQDNQELLRRDPGYPDRLRRLPEMLRRAYLDGDWDIFAGQFFALWRSQTGSGHPWHVWSEAFAREHYGIKDDAPFPPQEWLHWSGIDGGTRDPWVWLSAVRAPDKRVLVYREAGGPGVQVPDQAREMLSTVRREGEPMARYVADPSMFANRANLSVSDAEVYLQHGVRLTKGNNNRHQGWRRVSELLSETLSDGFPALVVLDSCTNLIRTLPELQADDLDHEDISDEHGRYDPYDPRSLRDDWGDALRYLITPTAAAPIVRRAQTYGPPPTATYESERSGVRSGW